MGRRGEPGCCPGIRREKEVAELTLDGQLSSKIMDAKKLKEITKKEKKKKKNNNKKKRTRNKK